MVRDVRFDIEASDKSGQAFTSIRRNLKGAEQDGRRLESVLAKTRAQVTSLGKLGGIGSNLISATAIGSVLSLSGALAKARDAIAKFDAISDNAAAAGLSTDFFQAMGAGAVQAGTDVGKMNEALVTLARNSGLAAEGKGRMVAQLRALNPELLANIQAATTQEQRVRLVADALAKEDDAARRAAIGAATLGNNWSELAEIFVRGSAGIDQIIASAREMGLIVPEGLLQRAGELEGKLNTISLVIDTQLNAALIELGPLLTFAAESVAQFAKDLRNIGETGQFMLDFVNALDQGKTVTEALRAAWAGLGNDIAANSQAATSRIVELKAEIAAVESTINRAKAAYGDGFVTATEKDIQRLQVLRNELARVQAQADALNASGHRRSEDESMLALEKYRREPATREPPPALPPPPGQRRTGSSDISVGQPLDLLEGQRSFAEMQKEGEAAAKAVQDSWNNSTLSILSSIQSLSSTYGAENSRMARIGKTAALASAIINTAQGVTKALASLPPPANFAAAAAVGAAGAAQVAAIGAQGFASGGHVRGAGTSRSDSIPALLSNGEYVVNAKAAGAYRGFLDAINFGALPKLAAGGLAVPPTPATLASPSRAVPANMHLSVSVHGSGDKELMARMEVGARQAAGQAIAQYDRGLPSRVHEIGRHPRVR